MAYTYKTTVENFVRSNLLLGGYMISSIPQKYSSREFDIGRFVNYLFIKKTDQETLLYKGFKGLRSKETDTAHVGIKILRTITAKTPKDLLRFVFSREGEAVTEIMCEGTRYVCIYHSLFVDEHINILRPVFLATHDSNTYKHGLIIFSSVIDEIKSNLASTIMGSLVPLISIKGGGVTIEKVCIICKWVCNRVSSLSRRILTPNLSLDIAKYYEKVWTNG